MPPETTEHDLTTMEGRLAVLQGVSLFADNLTGAEMRQLAEGSRERRFRDSDYLCRRTEPDAEPEAEPCCWYIYRGSVRVEGVSASALTAQVVGHLGLLDRDFARTASLQVAHGAPVTIEVPLQLLRNMKSAALLAHIGQEAHNLITDLDERVGQLQHLDRRDRMG